jgi:hypothetical protein
VADKAAAAAEWWARCVVKFLLRVLLSQQKILKILLRHFLCSCGLYFILDKPKAKQEDPKAQSKKASFTEVPHQKGKSYPHSEVTNSNPVS